MPSKFAKLANATFTFSRTLTTREDPITGEEIPDTVETYTTRAYIKREEATYEQGDLKDNRGESHLAIPMGAYTVVGYTVGILPDWCKTPIDPQIKCSIDNLGSGYFCFQGKIHVVYDKISKKGQTTPFQGYFVIQGSGEANAGFV